MKKFAILALFTLAAPVAAQDRLDLIEQKIAKLESSTNDRLAKIEADVAAIKSQVFKLASVDPFAVSQASQPAPVQSSGMICSNGVCCLPAAGFQACADPRPTPGWRFLGFNPQTGCYEWASETVASQASGCTSCSPARGWRR